MLQIIVAACLAVADGGAEGEAAPLVPDAGTDVPVSAALTPAPAVAAEVEKRDGKP